MPVAGPGPGPAGSSWAGSRYGRVLVVLGGAQPSQPFLAHTSTGKHSTIQ